MHLVETDHWKRKRKYRKDISDKMVRLDMKEVWYDSEEDILGVQVSKKKYSKRVEVAPNVVVDISESGEITGFEILKARKSFKKDVSLVVSAASKRS
jgi:uncharacterized protein YuzE